jgi:hypothetical protein
LASTGVNVGVPGPATKRKVEQLLLARDAPLRSIDDRVGNVRDTASHTVVGPRLGQIPVRIDRKIVRPRCDRKTGSHLAIARFTKGSAVLPLHPRRLIALFLESPCRPRSTLRSTPVSSSLPRRSGPHTRVSLGRASPTPLRNSRGARCTLCTRRISTSPSRYRFKALGFPFAEQPQRKRLATSTTPEALANSVKIPRELALSGPLERVTHSACSHQRAKRAYKTGQ